MKQLLILLIAFVIFGCGGKDAPPDYAAQLAGTYDGIEISVNGIKEVLPQTDLTARAKITGQNNAGTITVTITANGQREEQMVNFTNVTLENGYYYLQREGANVIYVHNNRLYINETESGVTLQLVLEKL